MKVQYLFYSPQNKYYLLTDGSGYPSAEFSFPLQDAKRDDKLVVAETVSSLKTGAPARF